MFRVTLIPLLLVVFMPNRPVMSDEIRELKIVTHNVWYGFTRKPEPRYTHWRTWMAEQNPDIVSLQELNGYTAEKLADDAAFWGHGYSELLKEDGFSTGITSRFPISDVKRIREGMHHGLLRCRIQGIWVYVIHFHPSNWRRRIEEAALLQKDVDTLPESDPPVVLAGDFNGFSPADRAHYETDPELIPFFQMLDQRDTNARNLNDGRMDYGGIEAVLSQGYVDLIARARTPQSQFTGTFPTRLVSDENHGTDRRLDYIFVSQRLLPLVVSAQILRDDVTEQLSDHIPVTATLRLAADDAEADLPVFETEATLLQDQGAGEGPAWHPQLGLLTSGDGHINVRNRDGVSSVYRSSAGSNGLLFEREGRLLICEATRRRVTRLESDGTVTVLAETFGGKKFNQPNDLAVDSRNRIYFSDPCYGDRSHMEMKDGEGRAIEGVYRIDNDGTVTRIITHEVDRPNGLVVSHDDRWLFVADNNNDTVGGARKLWRFRLSEEGTIDPDSRTLIHDWGTTRGPDGMKLDDSGRLFVAAGLNRANLPFESAESPTAGIYVFSRNGQLLDFMPVPRDETTNCAFGGDDLRTLYVTAGGTLWSLRTRVPGRPIWPRRDTTR